MFTNEALVNEVNILTDNLFSEPCIDPDLIFQEMTDNKDFEIVNRVLAYCFEAECLPSQLQADVNSMVQALALKIAPDTLKERIDAEEMANAASRFADMGN